MVTETSDSADDDWRLTAELEVADGGGELHKLIGRLRGGEHGGIVDEVEAAVPRDAVITHDGRLLFAYAADQATLAAARSAIETVLAREQTAVSVRISRWDEELDRWVQTDPPLSSEQARADTDAERDAQQPETRTMVATAGRPVRAEFERTMSAWAQRLSLECKIVEHPHLLNAQVAFTVTGPKFKVDEFARGLDAEGWAYVRAETGVMLSPL
jgi:hypothetical protein